jgi:hypothetical protein
MKQTAFLSNNNLQKNLLFNRLLFIVFASFLLAGCATGLKQEVSQLEANIAHGNQAASTAKSWLNNNSDVYDGRNCLIAERRGAEPRFSCHTKEESRKKGLALCAAQYKGCSAVVAALGSELDSWDKKFLVSEACEQLLAEFTGEHRSSVNTVVDGTLEYAKESCKNGGLWGLLLGCPTALVGEAVKFSQFDSCVNNKTQECYNNYANWVNEPTDRQSKCEANLALIAKTELSISNDYSVLREKKKSFMWKLFGDH